MSQLYQLLSSFKKTYLFYSIFGQICVTWFLMESKLTGPGSLKICILIPILTFLGNFVISFGFFFKLYTLPPESLTLMISPWLIWSFIWVSNPAGNYMFKVSNANTRTRCEICSKLTKRQQNGIGIFLVSLLLTLKIFHTLVYCLYCQLWAGNL